MTPIPSTKAMPPRSHQRFLTWQSMAGRTAGGVTIVCLTASLLTAGCGGSGGGARLSSSVLSPSGSVGSSLSTAAGIGRAAITIHWPARTNSNTRLIPEASNSIVVQMVRASDGKVLQSQTVPRPAGTNLSSDVTFDNLPVDTLTVVATAYPNADGTGTAQATGTGSLTTAADGTTASFGVTMGSIIDHISVTAPSAFLLIGKTLPLVATAYNAANEKTASVVLVAPDQLSWSVSSVPDGAATVDGKGLVTGQAAGIATVTVQDKESGKSANETIKILVKQTGPDSIGPAQFNPNGIDYVGTTTVADGSGGWVATGDTYVFDTTANPPTLTDTNTKTLVATGKRVTQTFGQARASVTYAVFDFPKDITLTGTTTVSGTGTNPLVVLTQGSFTLGGSASISVANGGGASGPGAGGYVSPAALTFYLGGGGFGGAGGGGTVNRTVLGGATYGSDFADASKPHLQGGSAGAGIFGNTGYGGGGAVYIGAFGSLTLGGTASVLAGGVGGSTSYGGGSGGGIALFGGSGVTITGSPKVDASGGAGFGGSGFKGVMTYGYGGGGGRIVVGYGAGTAAPDISFVTVNGGGYTPNYGGPGSAGVKSAVSFTGF